MSDIPLVVRVAANIDDLRANLAEGVSQIETTSTAMRQMATAYDGSRAISQAGATAAAIQAVGGATNLTAAEQEKANVILQAGLDKYAALGKEAPAGMQALADATKQSQTSWESFVNGFNIKDAITDPIGAASTGAAAFADALGPVGLGLSAAVALMTVFAKEEYDLAAQAGVVGNNLQDMSYKTGIAIGPLSNLSAAAQIAGSSIDVISAAVFMMQRRMTEGTPAFTQGIDRIGLSVSQLKALSPDQQFLAIAAGIQAVGDPATRSAAAMEIFGRQGREILPLLMKNVQDLSDASAALGLTWTDTDAKSAEVFQEKSNELNLALQNVKTTIGRDLVPGFTVAMDFAAGSVGYILTSNVVSDTLRDLRFIATLIKGGTDAPTPSVKPPAAFSTNDDSIDVAAKGMETYNVALATLENHLTNLAALDTELTPLQKQFAIEMQAGGDSTKTISDYLQVLGPVSEKSVQDFLKWNDALANNKGAIAELTKLQSEYYDVQATQSGTSSSIAIANINKTYETLWATLTASGKMSDDVAAQLDANWGQALGGVGVDWAALRTNSINSLQDTFNKAQETLTAMTYDGLVHSQAQIQHFRDIRDAALDAYRQAGDAAETSGKRQEAAMAATTAFWGGSLQKMGNQTVSVFDSMSEAQGAFADGLDASTIKVKNLAGEVISLADAQKQFDAGNSITYDLSTASGLAYYRSMNPGATFSQSDAQIEAFSLAGGTLQQLINSGVINPYGAMAGAMPVRDAGGPVTAGQSYMIGLNRQPEIFTAGASGFITPMGASSGTTNVTNVYVTQPLGTPAAIAAAVDQALMARQRNTGQRMAA